MKTIVIVIGNSDDKLSQQEWSAYVEGIREIVMLNSVERWFYGGTNFDSDKQRACFVFSLGPLATLDSLRSQVRLVRARYRQVSAAVVVGDSHLV